MLRRGSPPAEKMGGKGRLQGTREGMTVGAAPGIVCSSQPRRAPVVARAQICPSLARFDVAGRRTPTLHCIAIAAVVLALSTPAYATVRLRGGGARLDAGLASRADGRSSLAGSASPGAEAHDGKGSSSGKGNKMAALKGGNSKDNDATKVSGVALSQPRRVEHVSPSHGQVFSPWSIPHSSLPPPSLPQSHYLTRLPPTHHTART